MKYFYTALLCVVLFLMAKFTSGFMAGLLETGRCSDIITFVFGNIYGNIATNIYSYYENKKDNK